MTEASSCSFALIMRYTVPVLRPDAAAMSRIVVASKPRRPNSLRAAASRWATRSSLSLSAASHESMAVCAARKAADPSSSSSGGGSTATPSIMMLHRIAGISSAPGTSPNTPRLMQSMVSQSHSASVSRSMPDRTYPASRPARRVSAIAASIAVGVRSAIRTNSSPAPDGGS